MENWEPKVGDKVYIVPYTTRCNSGYVTITKVGRLYAEYGDRWLKIDLSNMTIIKPKYGVRGYVYKSEQDYIHQLEMIEKRRYIKDNLHKFTDEQVETVYDMLKPKYENPTEREPKQ